MHEYFFRKNHKTTQKFEDTLKETEWSIETSLKPSKRTERGGSRLSSLLSMQERLVIVKHEFWELQNKVTERVQELGFTKKDGMFEVKIGKHISCFFFYLNHEILTKCMHANNKNINNRKNCCQFV